MLFERAVRILLTTVLLIQCQMLVMAAAYTQVASSGSGHGEGPKIYKALNLELIFPKSFNSSENVVSTTSAAPAPSMEGSGSGITNVVVDGGRQQQQQQQQYNPLPQSNEQTYRDAVGDDIVDDGDKQPLYVTPSPNEAALYGAQGAAMGSSNRNGVNNGNGDVQVVTEKPINIQQQQPQRQQHQQQHRQQHLNDKNNNYNAAKEQQNIATGRAVDYHTGYPFGQLITPLIKNAPRPVYSSSQGKPVASSRPPPPPPSSSSSSSASNVGKIALYPQTVYQQKPPNQAEIDKFRGKGTFRDRFTPSEAVASHQLKSGNRNQNHHHHNHAPTYTEAGRIPAPSNVVNSYVPPKNLYSFPPNNANYPLPGQDNKLGQANNVVNSYSPPPSGPLKDVAYPLTTASSNDNGYKYAGPLNMEYLPTINNNNDNGDTKDHMNNNAGIGNGDGDGTDADNGDINDSIGVLPASVLDGIDNPNDMDSMGSMDMKDEHSNGDTHDDHSYDTEKEYPTPPPEWLKAHPEAAHEHPPHDHDHDEHHHEIDFDHDHDHDHHHHHHHHPDIIIDHDSHSYPYHHSFPSFPVYPHYPEIIYDDHHDHHEHHHDEPPPPATTEAPLPEPPPEPRVKKYSYFYIGRKLWYIPLYFTVWFSFYVLWLILKSIARHKVNLPNHYVARRSVDNYNLSKRQQEIINQLTVSVLDKIENFKRLNLN